MNEKNKRSEREEKDVGLGVVGDFISRRPTPPSTTGQARKVHAVAIADLQLKIKGKKIIPRAMTL